MRLKISRDALPVPNCVYDQSVCACCGGYIASDIGFKENNYGITFNVSKEKSTLENKPDRYEIVSVPLDDGFFLNLKLSQHDTRAKDVF